MIRRIVNTLLAAAILTATAALVELLRAAIEGTR